jgi:AraC family transcriptional activator of pobA
MNIDFNTQNYYLYKLSEFKEIWCNKDYKSNDFYQIFFLKSATGKFVIDFKEYKDLESKVSAIFPNQIHDIQVDNNSEGYVIMFNDEIFCTEKLQKELKAYCVNIENKLNFIDLSNEEYHELEEIVKLIYSYSEQKSVFHNEQVRHFVKIILLSLLDKTKDKVLNTNESNSASLFYEYSAMVDNEFKENRQVANYAEKLGVSTKKLNFVSKEVGGKTSIQIIHDRIFSEARKMIAFSENSLKEIAYELGFDSPSAFNKFILKKSGEKPSDLRKKLNQMYNYKE